MTFGERLKKFRLDKGITQQQLGQKIGVSDRVIGYYESDDRFPKDDEILKKLADYFNVTLDELLGRTINEPTIIAARTNNNIDLSELTEKGKEYIRDLVERMKNTNN